MSITAWTWSSVACSSIQKACAARIRCADVIRFQRRPGVTLVGVGVSAINLNGILEIRALHRTDVPVPVSSDAARAVLSAEPEAGIPARPVRQLAPARRERDL